MLRRKSAIICIGIFVLAIVSANGEGGHRDFGLSLFSDFRDPFAVSTIDDSGAPFGSATVLAGWNTFGNAGTETSEPSSVTDPNISPATLTLGSGVTVAANGNRFGGSAWFDTGDMNPTTVSDSIAGNDYIEFTVSSLSGYRFTPTALSFVWDRSSTGPSSVALRSSADGFSTNLGTVTGIASGAFATNTINISGISNRTSLTFRLYGYGATAAAGTGGFDTSASSTNVSLTGTVEPVYQLLVNASGSGTVVSDVGSISCPPVCSASFAPSTVVNLTATANAGSVFTGWSGDCGGMICALTMSTNRTVTGTFVRLPPTISALPLSRTEGTAVSGVTIANVGDAVDPPASITVTVDGGTSATRNGVSITNIVVGAGGIVTADVAVSAGASDAGFTLTATNLGGASASSRLPVSVTPVCPDSARWTEKQEFGPVGETTTAGNGSSVDIDGDTMISGAPFSGAGSTVNRGEAYVFRKSGAAWVREPAPMFGSAASQFFGSSVAISGDTAVVGAPGPFGPGGGIAERVYVFTRSGSAWSLQQTLSAVGGGIDENFGTSVAIDGDTIVVGAPTADAARGAAYVFTRNAAVWIGERILAADALPNSYFGQSVAISGDRVAAVSWNAAAGTYVLTRNGTLWGQQKIDNSPAYTVSISGSVIVSGRGGLRSQTGPGIRTVRIFEYSGTFWNLAASFTNAFAEEFGQVTSVSGNTVAVAAFYEDVLGETQAGAVHIFQRIGGTWTEQRRINASDFAAGEHFGTGLAISGNDILVGTPGGDIAPTYDRGTVYWFRRDCPPSVNPIPVNRTAGAGSLNSQIATVSDPVEAPGTLAVTVNGGPSATVNGVTVSNIAVGVSGEVTADVTAATGATDAAFTLRVTNSQGDTGDATLTVEVFPLCPVGNLARQSAFGAPDAAANDHYGVSVAINGDTAVVGASDDDNAGGTDSGAAYVYVRDLSGNWVFQQKLTASDGQAFDQFGFSVAVSGDTIIVGAYDDSTPAGNQSGSAYVFNRSAGVWTESQKINSTDNQAGDNFGISVALSGDTAVIGADLADSGFEQNAGAAYVFTRVGAGFVQERKLLAPSALFGDQFGQRVAVSGETIAIGAENDDVSTEINAGSVYVFVKSGGVWNLQQQLNAIDGAAGDRFGSSLSISGNTLVVGAVSDDNVGGTDAGAAYAFVRVGVVWIQEQKLTASAGSAFGNFGSVSISGNNLLVGAGGHPNGNGRGIAYMFRRTGGLWTQSQTLGLSNPAEGGFFGGAVALSTDRALIGASNDGSFGIPNAGSVFSYSFICATPEMGVSGFGNPISDGDTSPSLNDGTDFGTVGVSGGTVTRAFTIANTGDADLLLNGSPIVSIAGPAADDFSVIVSPLSPVLPSGTTTFQITFDPSADGLRGATVSIANNDSDENPYDFAIAGNGTSAAAALTVVRTGSGFGSVSSDPAGIDCGPDCTETYGIGTLVTLSAFPGPGSVFTNWSGGGCSLAPVCTLTINEAVTVTANFDTAPTVIQFSAPTFVEDESQTAIVTVRRSGNIGTMSSVRVDSSNGTAFAGTCGAGGDFEAVTAQTLNFFPGLTSMPVAIAICSDSLTEPTETFGLALSSPVGATLGSQTTTVVSINDTASDFRAPDPIDLGTGGVGSVYPAEIPIAGGPTSIGGIRVTLYDVTQSDPDNLDVLLVGPNGAKYVLLADAGGTSPIDPFSPVTLTFSDNPAGMQIVPDSLPMLSGHYLPTTWETPVTSFPAPAPAAPYIEPGSSVSRPSANTLIGAFGSSNSNGVWRLYVRDDGGAFAPFGTGGSIAGGWGIGFLAPTAAGVSISGTVRDAEGNAVPKAVVELIDLSGNLRSVRTTSFGRYRFEDVPAGRNYLISVRAKEMRFAIRSLMLDDSIYDFDLAADP